MQTVEQLIRTLSEYPPHYAVAFSAPGKDAAEFGVDQMYVGSEMVMTQNVDVQHAPFVQVNLSDVLL